MKKEGQPSDWCFQGCEWFKHADFVNCRAYSRCIHLEDKKVPPRQETLHLPDGDEVVTIVGENTVFRPKWILSDGSMIHKDHPWR